MQNSFEDRLRGLFTLQQIDSNLDELEAQKGDLPEQVAVLENKFNSLAARIEELRTVMTTSVIGRDKADVDIITLQGKIEKYKNQQFQVRNNKEYDALTKEITIAESNIQKLQKQMDELESRMKAAKEDSEKSEQEKIEIEAQLNQRRPAPEAVSEMNKEEGLKLLHAREKVLVRADKTDIALYERIRKAKGGIAVVSVNRGACGGCHNRIPPQRLLELRQNSVILRCEHCGRILVSDEIVRTRPIMP